ncbi:hypothetical protein GCM10022408_09250 [Hymenobacter fastidiosus]|uniref:Uncharacterized protein n=1 Tax=Hymenobacter fastidiosus TaxID=486264 RepID=A0ABP7RPF8_9BACT
MRVLLSLLLTLGLLGGCKKESAPAAPATLQSRIIGRTWLESHEDAQPGSDIRVYRPETSAFPASWPRDGFRFDAGNVFTGYGPSPVDGTATFPGRWQTTGPDRFRITPNAPAGSYSLQLVSLENEVLRVRRLP